MGEAIKKEIEEKYNAGKKYLRAKEVAKYMGIGLSTVWAYAKEGKLTAKKISTRVTVFSIDDINTLINSVEVA
jgi:excisionase family DNA binding protein